jgi:hypothetical protein
MWLLSLDLLSKGKEMHFVKVLHFSSPPLSLLCFCMGYISTCFRKLFLHFPASSEQGLKKKDQFITSLMVFRHKYRILEKFTVEKGF